MSKGSTDPKRSGDTNKTPPEAAAASKPQIDPDLERQLDAAHDDEPVGAVLLLRQSATTHRPPPNVDALLNRVRETDGTDNVETNYMPRIGTLVVRARPDLIRQLIVQPEVEVASAYRLYGEAGL